MHSCSIHREANKYRMLLCGNFEMFSYNFEMISYSHIVVSNVGWVIPVVSDVNR